MRLVLALPLLILLSGARLLAGPLTPQVQNIVTSGASDRAHWGVYAVEVSSGRVLVDYGGQRLMVPASARKLVPTAMAHRYMGPGSTLETVVHAAGEPRDGRLAGDLVLRAVGDPSWTPALQNGRSGRAVLAGLAQSLASDGLGVVEGDLVIDTSRFEEPAPMARGREWEDFQTSDGPIASAAAIDRNLAAVVIEPGSVGQPVRVSWSLASAPFELVNQSTTGRAGSAPTINLYRGLEGTTLRITGSIPSDTGRATRSIPVGRPVEIVADEFRAALDSAGIRVEGRVRISESAVALGRPLASVRSATVADMMAVANKSSDNFIAESLYLLAGAEVFGRGSYRTAEAAEERLWRSLGVDSSEWRGVDGSGLARMNGVTPRALVTLLRGFADEPAFVDSLAVPGQTGTLRYRLTGDGLGSRVQAKTGTLTGAVSLAGYVTARNGRRVAFAIICNGNSAGANTIRADIDRIVALLAEQ